MHRHVDRIARLGRKILTRLWHPRMEKSTADDWTSPFVDLVREEDTARFANSPVQILLIQMVFDSGFPPYRPDTHGVCWWRRCDVHEYLVGDARWTTLTKNPDGSARGLGPLTDEISN